jgi:hypothetical protein
MRTQNVSAKQGRIGIPVQRPTAWWLETLRRRASRMYGEHLDLSQKVAFSSEAERRACVRFFNAALRAEESGLTGAHKLAEQVRAYDPDLAECLVLYGNEEGWHRELLIEFLQHIGGEVLPMGRVTGTFYRVYGRAEEMDSIMLTNLMFETVGSTTYRMALRRVRQPLCRQLLTILTRDESFHVPLNVHFIRETLRRRAQEGRDTALARLRLKGVYQVVFHALVLMSLASRQVAQDFDQIGWRELTQAYLDNLGRLFVNEHDLRFVPPKALLRAFGVDVNQLADEKDGPNAISTEAAIAAADREAVVVTAL